MNKFHCQRNFEDKSHCLTQCEHCKIYYASLKMKKQSLIYEFKNQTPEYAYGFQAGQIWELLKNCEPFGFKFINKIEEEVRGMIEHY